MYNFSKRNLRRFIAFIIVFSIALTVPKASKAQVPPPDYCALCRQEILTNCILQCLNKYGGNDTKNDSCGDCCHKAF